MVDEENDVGISIYKVIVRCVVDKVYKYFIWLLLIFFFFLEIEMISVIVLEDIRY